MSEPILAKLAFNGYNVTYHNHESRNIEEDKYPTVQSVLNRKFSPEEFPSAEDFAEDLYRVFGDTVGVITDNDGVVLYENMKEMKEMAALW